MFMPLSFLLCCFSFRFASEQTGGVRELGRGHFPSSSFIIIYLLFLFFWRSDHRIENKSSSRSTSDLSRSTSLQSLSTSASSSALSQALKSGALTRAESEPTVSTSSETGSGLSRDIITVAPTLSQDASDSGIQEVDTSVTRPAASSLSTQRSPSSRFYELLYSPLLASRLYRTLVRTCYYFEHAKDDDDEDEEDSDEEERKRTRTRVDAETRPHHVHIHAHTHVEAHACWYELEQRRRRSECVDMQTESTSWQRERRWRKKKMRLKRKMMKRRTRMRQFDAVHGNNDNEADAHADADDDGWVSESDHVMIERVCASRGRVRKRQRREVKWWLM